MASERQIAANRLNARKSTGPRTARGKAAVRLNSVTHGLTARSIITHGEQDELEKLHAIRDGLEADWQPQSLTETLLLDEASACWWRLQRGRAAEDYCYAASVKHLEGHIDDWSLVHPNHHFAYDRTKKEIVGAAFRGNVAGQELTRISLYMGRNFRQFYRCFQQIQQLRKNRQLDPEPLPECPGDSAPEPIPMPPDTAEESMPNSEPEPVSASPDPPAPPDPTVYPFPTPREEWQRIAAARVPYSRILRQDAASSSPDPKPKPDPAPEPPAETPPEPIPEAAATTQPAATDDPCHRKRS